MLGGALKPPGIPPDKFETWDDPGFPVPLQQDLARLINLPDDYQQAGHPDPIITPPLYGTWHAMMKRVLENADHSPITPNDNWVHRLNLDPRYRVAAGCGTRVIQDQQEPFMDAAWEQIGKVLEAQRRIRLGQFGVHVSGIWFDRHLMPMLAVSRQKTLLMMAPLNKRIVTGGVTIHHALSDALVQQPMTSPALRRIVRPRGRLIRSLPFTGAVTTDQLIDRVNAGEVSAAPPKVTPPGVVTFEQAADQTFPKDAPPIVIDWLRRWPQLPLLVLIAAIVLALLLFLLLPLVLAVPIAAIVVGAGVYLYRRLNAWRQRCRHQTR